MPARTADEILIERAQRDFDDGLAHARKRIKETHGRIAGATLDALIVGAVTTLHVRARMAEDVQALIALARRAIAGEDPDALATAHLDHVLRLKQKMGLIAREDDPAFLRIKEMMRVLFARRLPDLGRMANVQEPTDYDDLVRRAFPERAEVDALVEDNARRVLEIIDMLEKNPHVLRAPKSFVPGIASMAREFTAWKVAEVKRGVDEIYAKTA